MKEYLNQFFKSFIALFFLANFVIGSAAHALIPRLSPVPEFSTMIHIGIGTAILTAINLLRGA